MSCCSHCKAAEKVFGEKAAKRDLKRYRRKGPDKTTAAVIEAIEASTIDSGSLLDIGAGIGVLHHELLGAAAGRAVHVDASEAYLDAAREESGRRGSMERICFVHGDVVDLADELGAADIVTLDRVICCYPDVGGLLAVSAGKARRLWVASYPRDAWYVRVFVRLGNAVLWLTRNPFRAFVHPIAKIDKALTGAGFERCFCR
ncbi:MAG: methyltransferase domain-containing protein, partial [Acidobacteriota bacterium]|nr:methyltransferase domain-containing protein [Acidobacteriota bacterium]